MKPKPCEIGSSAGSPCDFNSSREEVSGGFPFSLCLQRFPVGMSQDAERQFQPLLLTLFLGNCLPAQVLEIHWAPLS